MSKYGIFSVYDKSAEAFLPPFFVQTKGLAVRAFTSAVDDVGHHFNKHKSDYTLFELGEFDELSGYVISFSVPAKIMTALEASAKHDEQPSSFGNEA